MLKAPYMLTSIAMHLGSTTLLTTFLNAMSRKGNGVRQAGASAYFGKMDVATHHSLG